MVEGARLEIVYTPKGIQGSNPCLSAIYNKALPCGGFVVYDEDGRMRTLDKEGVDSKRQAGARMPVSRKL